MFAARKKPGHCDQTASSNHCALHMLCTMIRESAGLDLQYCGESAGVLANKFMQMLTRRRRETIGTETKDALMARQDSVVTYVDTF